MSSNVTFKSLLVQADLKLAMRLHEGRWCLAVPGSHSHVAWQAPWGDACPAFISAKWTWQHLQAEAGRRVLSGLGRGEKVPGFSCSVEEGLAFLYNASKSMQLGKSRDQAVCLQRLRVFSEQYKWMGPQAEKVPWDNSCGVPQPAQSGENSNKSVLWRLPPKTSFGCQGHGNVKLTEIRKGGFILTYSLRAQSIVAEKP